MTITDSIIIVTMIGGSVFLLGGLSLPSPTDAVKNALANTTSGDTSPSPGGALLNQVLPGSGTVNPAGQSAVNMGKSIIDNAGLNGFQHATALGYYYNIVLVNQEDPVTAADEAIRFALNNQGLYGPAA